MRFIALVIAVTIGLGSAACPRPAVAQADRDFLLTDDEGHLLVRFAGPEDPSPSQREGMTNMFLSVMVQDRLWADIDFEYEPVDSGWSARTTPQIETYVRQTWPELPAIDVECRSATCRLVLEHADLRTVSEHRALMAFVEDGISAFVAAEGSGFAPSFLITAYSQVEYPQHIKVFLERRTGDDAARHTSN